MDDPLDMLDDWEMVLKTSRFVCRITFTKTVNRADLFYS